MCRVLEARAFPLDGLRLFSSPRSAGTEVVVAGQPRRVEDAATADLSGIDIALFAAGSDASRALAPRFVAAGATVIDNSSAFREDPAVPLIVPEINAAALLAGPCPIVANPNCSTIIMLMAVAPLHRRFGATRVIVSTYQSVSGAGKAARDELFDQAAAFGRGEPGPVQVYDRPIFMNLIPQIGDGDEGSLCVEERKMVAETHKILGTSSIAIYPTTVRVPVERCHSMSVHVEFGRAATREEVLAAFADMPGLRYVAGDSAVKWPTPRELSGSFETQVGRLRAAGAGGTGWMFWVVSDQLLKGAALNAVQIAEMLVQAGRT